MCWCGETPCADTEELFWMKYDQDPDEFLRIETILQRWR